MKLSHVIPCDPKLCNLGYNKIVFTNGFVAEVGSNGKDVVNYRCLKTKTSSFYFMELSNGNSCCLSERWVRFHKKGKYGIEIIQHANLDKNGCYYTTQKTIEVDESIFNKYWKGNWFE